MAYEVLARKWRPQRFREVLGQQHITRTLQNAILKSRVGHAYLFVGPRGTGKTTSARIFAKALNCTSPETGDNGTIEPCCTCDTCREIAAGTCLDVMEIDGASHNKVDDIRELREHVQYTPTNGRKYKIYIIDEVHMLTTAAWNALLKTLEEPPPHIKFLFATTEAHKVLPTITSRCQRFDLKRIAVPVIVSRLRHIADNETIAIADDALNVIARAADGAMRDAQSIFDQMIAFCGGRSGDAEITEDDVTDVFGLSSSSDIRQLIGALAGRDAGDVVRIVNQLADKGRNLERLYADLLVSLRNVMVFSYVKQPETIIELSDSEFAEYKSLAETAPPTVIQRLIEILMSHEQGMRTYLNKRIFIEVTLLRAMHDAHAVTLDDVISNLRAAHAADPQPPAAASEQSAEAPSRDVTRSPEAHVGADQAATPADESETSVSEQPVDEPPPEKSHVAVPETHDDMAPDADAPQTPTCDPTTAPTDSVADDRPAPNQPDSATPERSTDAQDLFGIEPIGAESTHTLPDTASTPVADAPASPTKSVLPENTNESGVIAHDTMDVSPVERFDAAGKKLVAGKAVRAAVEQNPFVQLACETFGGQVVDARG